MAREYNFYDDTYYSSIGCSCCEPTEMECWNSDEIYHSCHSVDDCYVSAITDSLNQLSFTELIDLARHLKLTVNFHKEDEK